MRLGSVMAAAGTAIALLAWSAAPAVAHDGGPPWGEPLQCRGSDGYVYSCFEQNGDDFWVRDDEEDGYSAVVVWWTSDSSGRCRNTHGAGRWHECDIEMREGITVRWEHRVYDGDTGHERTTSPVFSASTSS